MNFLGRDYFKLTYEPSNPLLYNFKGSLDIGGKK